MVYTRKLLDKFCGNIIPLHLYLCTSSSPSLRPLDIFCVESTPRFHVWIKCHGYQLTTQTLGQYQKQSLISFQSCMNWLVASILGKDFSPLESLAITWYLVETITSHRGKMICSCYYNEHPAMEGAARWHGEFWAMCLGLVEARQNLVGLGIIPLATFFFESPLPNGEYPCKCGCVYLQAISDRAPQKL